MVYLSEVGGWWVVCGFCFVIVNFSYVVIFIICLFRAEFLSRIGCTKAVFCTYVD